MEMLNDAGVYEQKGLREWLSTSPGPRYFDLDEVLTVAGQDILAVHAFSVSILHPPTSTLHNQDPDFV